MSTTEQDVVLRMRLENQAQAGFREIQREFGQMANTLRSAFVETKQGKEGMVELDSEMKKLADTANFVRNEIDNITDQLKLFGEQGLQAANALEEIADPVRRMAEGQRLLARVIRESTSELNQLQDAAKVRIAENNLRDMTDTLSRLSPAGQRAAASLGDVADVGRRNAVAASVMRQELAGPRGLAGIFGRLGDEVNIAKAQFQSLPPLMQGAVLGAIGAVTAATLALSKAVVDAGVAAWKAWAKQSLEAQRAQGQLTSSMERLQVQAGRLVEQHLQITDVMYGAAAAMDTLADASSGLSKSWGEVSGPLETAVFGLGKISAQARDGLASINPLFNAVQRGGEWLEWWGEIERKRVDDLRKFSATTDIVTATITRMNDELAKTVDASNTATTAMTQGMQGALNQAAELAAQIRKIEEAWDDVTALDRGVAVGAITEAGAGALSQKRGGGGSSARKQREEELKAWNEEIKLRSRMEREAEDSLRRLNQTKMDLIDEFAAHLAVISKGDAGAGERSSVMTELQQAQLELSRAYTQDATLGMGPKDKEIAELNQLASYYDAVAASINGASNEAIQFGLSAAAGVATALIAGQSMSSAFLDLLGNVGEFAQATGQTMLLAALGELALAGGNPVLAAALGGSLLALGIGLSAAHGRVTANRDKKGASASAGSAGEGRLREIADAFRSQNQEDREGRTVQIFIDGDQIQGVVERGVSRGIQRGAFGTPQPAGFLS